MPFWNQLGSYLSSLENWFCLSEKCAIFSARMAQGKTSKSIDNKVLNRVYGSGRGSVFETGDFLDLGSRTAIDKVLSRLVQRGTLRRLARGLYDYPKYHPIIGVVSPNPDKVAKALAGKHAIRLQPTGAYAANLLGLSEQVPAKVVFLTDGTSKVVHIGKQEIRLQHTSPRNMATAGRISGLVIQALRHLGRNYVDERVIAILRKKLSDKDKLQLIKDIAYAPAWVGTYLRSIATGTRQS